MVKFGLLTTTFSWLMSTHPKSTLLVLHMLMHLSSGHMILLRENLNSWNFSPNRTCTMLGVLTLGFATIF